VIGFVALQFVVVEVQSDASSLSIDEIEAPNEMMSILRNSCYDCHSSSVNMPWHGYIAPSSWIVY